MKTVSDRVLLDSMIMGEHYTARRLASTHNINERDVRITLARLVNADPSPLRTQRVNNTFVFARVATLIAGLPPMAPMKISREMREAMERTKELRVHESKF